MPKKKYYLYVAELSADVLTEDVKRRNPHRNPNRPIVKIGYITNELPRDRFPNGDFSTASSPMLKQHGARLLALLGGANEYAKGSMKEEGILSALKETVEKLRKKGYTVYNRPLPKRRRLYVIELKPEILSDKQPNMRYTEEKPAGGYSREPMYVGETGKSREDRLEDHLNGNNSRIHPYAKRFRNDLAEPLAVLDRLEALRGERKLAWRLGQQGYPVYGGH